MTNSDNAGDFSHDQCDMIVHMPTLEDYASRAAVIIEIGVGHGNGSTRAFARGLARSEKHVRVHVGVDMDPVRPQIKPDRFWCEVHGMSEDPATASWVKIMLGDRMADIIFIDTVHTYEQMVQELPIWAAFSGPETIWLFHDTWMFGPYNQMTEAIKEFAAANGLEYTDLSRESHGLGMMRKA